MDIVPSTRHYWRKKGVPILDGEKLDVRDFPDGNGKPTPFYSERQAKRILEARKNAGDALVSAKKAASRCRVAARLVTQLAHDGEIEAELRPTQIGPQTFQSWRVSVQSLRQALQRHKQAKTRPKEIPDPVATDEAADLCGVRRGTIQKWIRQKKIRSEELGPRLVVSRREALEFAAARTKTLGNGESQPWLYRRQVRSQYPRLPRETLSYYTQHPLPPLGRPIHVRLVDRPPGLITRYKRVRQFFAADVSVFVKWLHARGNGGEAQPVNGQAKQAEEPPTPGRRGRKRSPRTRELGEFCYSQLAEEVKRRTICLRVQERFNRTMNISDVTTYARRYAKDNGKPWPL
jgi:excisionase family DNA binding protein